MTPSQLKNMRAKLRLTQEALAAQLGVTRNTVVRWEMGMHPIPPMAVRLIQSLHLKK